MTEPFPNGASGHAGRVTLPVGWWSYPLGASAPLPLSQGESCEGRRGRGRVVGAIRKARALHALPNAIPLTLTENKA